MNSTECIARMVEDYLTLKVDDYMLIRVRYNDSHYDYVNRFQLNRLLENRQIVGFLRSSGWATIGVDPLRGKTTMPVAVKKERRSSL